MLPTGEMLLCAPLLYLPAGLSPNDAGGAGDAGREEEEGAGDGLSDGLALVSRYTACVLLLAGCRTNQGWICLRMAFLRFEDTTASTFSALTYSEHLDRGLSRKEDARRAPKARDSPTHLASKSCLTAAWNSKHNNAQHGHTKRSERTWSFCISLPL